MRNQRLENARLKAGFQQQEVAKRAGISKHAYWTYEHGQHVPKVTTAFAIADALGTTVDKLFRP